MLSSKLTPLGINDSKLSKEAFDMKDPPPISQEKTSASNVAVYL